MGEFRRERNREDFPKREFRRDKPFDSSRRGDRDFNRKRLEMHTVICDKCGEECQVPFKPSSDKPVYCSACFRSQEGGSSSRRISPRGNIPPSNSNELKEINGKLDKIIEMLEQFEVVENESSEDEEDKESD
jgi:CxxC-x17-CxxC domain-containing protein